MAILQPLEDLILYTEFNMKVYESEVAWIPVITPLGQCFSFDTNKKISIAGISAGLIVYAWLDQALYPDAMQWAGVCVYVTPHNNNDTMISHQVSTTVLILPRAVSSAAVTRQDFQ